jgi:hypothetical protein
MENQKVKFYNKEGFALLMLFFLITAPIGIFLMWKNNIYSIKSRVITSLVFGILFLIIVPSSSSENEKQNIKTDTVTLESTKEEEKEADVYDDVNYDLTETSEVSKVPEVTTEIEEEPEYQEIEIEEEEEDLIPEITAAKLCQEYSNNELRANELYKGKLMMITGKVTSIGETFGIKYITLSDGTEYSILGLQCYFENEEDIKRMSTINNGDTITITGVVNGQLLNIEVKNCAFFDR